MLRRLAIATVLVTMSSCLHQCGALPGEKAGRIGSTDAGLSGKVLAVRPEVCLAMISLGSDQGARPGLRFWAFRDGKAITDIEVEQVFEDMSSARVFGGSWRRGPKKGDDVSIARGMYPPSAGQRTR
ncbi:MAG: hypothetical protein ACYS9X_06020 [Planctomycetota bacterium]|jgi:hypothetical protein